MLKNWKSNQFHVKQKVNSVSSYSLFYAFRNICGHPSQVAYAVAFMHAHSKFALSCEGNFSAKFGCSLSYVANTKLLSPLVFLYQRYLTASVVQLSDFGEQQDK